MIENTAEENAKRYIRWLIWAYFWLLIVEGALRKWVLPSLSNPLLIVRDPVVILAYLLAIRGGIVRRNGWVYSILAIGIFSFAISCVVLLPYVPPLGIFLVSGFGFRANFLHLPLIFLIPRVMRIEDVKRLGWWTLLLMVPMAILMVGQFRTSPDSFLNRTAGGEGEMLTSALGKVRTAGTFSYVLGVVAFLAMGTSYLIWATLNTNVYRVWLLIASGAALAIGIAVSGSRSVVGACAVVAASLLVVLFVRPSAVNRAGKALIAVAILALIVTRTPIFKEGFNVLSTRFSEVAEANDQTLTRGIVLRVADSFSEGLYAMIKAPFWGYGLGVGTNAGARFLTGRNTFLLAEGEWSRVFLESGPVLGLAYVLWRCAVVIAIGMRCVRAVRAANVLPLLLFSSSFLPLLNGQFGQPTVLGFAVLATGLALAALDTSTGTTPALSDDAMAAPPPRRVPSRSPYANRLHGPSTNPQQTNGAVDR